MCSVYYIAILILNTYGFMILDCILVFLFVKVFVAIASKRLKMFGVLDESLLLKTSPWLISSDYEDQQDVMVEKARSSFTL